jgi:hypothetical protein
MVLNVSGAKVVRNDTAEAEEGAREQRVTNQAVSIVKILK